MRAIQMNIVSLRAGTLLLIAAAATWGVLGCGAEAPKPSYSSRNDSDFLAGANRPPTARTYYSMAKILATQGKDDQCRFILWRLINDYPDFLPAYCELAELHMRTGQLDLAKDTLQVAHLKSQKDPVILNNLGMCLLLKGEYHEALEAFTTAAGVNPNDARYRANMAVALGMMGRYDESLMLFKQLMPEADAHYNLGVLCEARNDADSAARAFSKSRAIRDATKAGPLPAGTAAESR